MLRFWFGVDDLANTRFLKPSPVMLVAVSLQALRRPVQPWLSAWQLRSRQCFPASARPLFDLFPPSGHTPDFVTPVAAGYELESAYESIRTVSADRIRNDLSVLSLRPRTAPAWVRQLASGDADARCLLVTALHDYYQACLAGYWPALRDHLQAEADHHARLLGQRGFQHVLGNLHPSLRWQSPILERHAPCCDHLEIQLDGRGMLLCPTTFLSGHPRALLFEGVPTLLFPAHTPFLEWDQDTSSRGDALGRLIGHTRASAMRALALDAASTIQLSHRLNVSPSAASLHVKALREAGLAATRRTGQAVEHTLTPLGLQLLERTGG